MKRKHWFLLLAGLVAGLFVSGRYAILAQDGAETPQANSRPAPPEKSGELPNVSVNRNVADERQASRTVKDAPSIITIQDALLRPYHFPFSRPTSLAQVCAHLKETLKGPVVLDLAALDRKNSEPEDTVQLELDGVRLKTGLKLLLDQVGLTYRVVAEDNLMIITDQEGAEDPAERIWSELRALTSRPARRPGCRRRDSAITSGSKERKGQSYVSRRSSKRCPRTPATTLRSSLKNRGDVHRKSPTRPECRRQDRVLWHPVFPWPDRAAFFDRRDSLS